MEVQVFYSYNLYDDSNRLIGFGSGSETGDRGGVWNIVMDHICKSRNCTYSNIHLISFNTI